MFFRGPKDTIVISADLEIFLQETWVNQKLSAVCSEESAGTEQVTRPSGSGVTQECRPVSGTLIFNLDNKLLLQFEHRVLTEHLKVRKTNQHNEMQNNHKSFGHLIVMWGDLEVSTMAAVL